MNNKSMIDGKNILVSAAVADELTIIFDAMENRKSMSFGGRSVTSGTIGTQAVTTVVTAPGVVNTAQALTACVEAYTPSMIIQTGCAGVFTKSGAAIGDIAVADCEIDIHTGIETERNDNGFIAKNLPFPLISNHNPEITNKYPVDKTLSGFAYHTIENTFRNEPQNIHYGPFITVSTITATDTRAKLLYDVYGAFMESMEGSSAAHIAACYKIPFIEIRAASNVVGKRDKSKWNLPLAFKQSNKAVLAFIRNLDT